MYFKDYISEFPGGDPVANGTEVKFYRISDDALLYTKTTTDGIVICQENGNPGPFYTSQTFGSDTRLVYGNLSAQFGNLYSGEFEQLLGLFQNAVISGLAISAPGGKFVQVATGYATADKNMHSAYSTENLAIADNATGNPRIDSVYIEVSNGSATPPYRTRAVIVQGTAAAVPVAPTFATANATGVHLADVLVNNGMSAIVTGNITDRRTFSAPTISDGSITAAKLATDVTDLIAGVYPSKQDAAQLETDVALSGTTLTALYTCTLPALPVGVSYTVVLEGYVDAEGNGGLCDGTITLAVAGGSTFTSGTRRWEHGVDTTHQHFAKFAITGTGIAKTCTLSATRIVSTGTLAIKAYGLRVNATPA